MSARPVLTALLVAGLAGPASASSWMCSDPETDQVRQELAKTQRTLATLTARSQRMERVLIEERDAAQEQIAELKRINELLRLRVSEFEKVLRPSRGRRTWSQVVENLRRDGDVNLGLSPVLEDMDARGVSSHRLRKLLKRLARYDGVLEAALESPPPERDLERLGVILDHVEKRSDRMAAEIVRRLERLEKEFGWEFSPDNLPAESLDTTIDCEFGADLDQDGTIECPGSADDDLDFFDDF